jgi:adenine-specific DNA-methyltransferase
MASEVGSNTSAKKSLMADFPDVPAFDTPKPVGLLERIIHIGSDQGEIVMDPFLGSGTAAVAASSLGRRWVGIEREEGTLRTFAVPRLTRLRGDHHDDGFRYLAMTNPPLA